MSGQFYAIQNYPQVKAAVLGGARGYYIDRNGYITIVLPDNSVECEFPTAAEYDGLPPGFHVTFNRDWEADFRLSVEPLLIRSTLSDPPAR